ncbi:hypothetical protein RclHR1_19870005 [Rhizophagus clarus]|uniref:Secreted protein n=1 Tax=Rhizophagus clarus TaxID=94130 RepID=A0A2Z6QDB1_9GLOM|nr:hypothetical protein RclHR1_14720001 [Rhizophagus clarus]GBB92219.1 hypothetical protein RclHR1_19870005 [Rhizophagus clarus]
MMSALSRVELVVFCFLFEEVGVCSTLRGILCFCEDDLKPRAPLSLLVCFRDDRDEVAPCYFFFGGRPLERYHLNSTRLYTKEDSKAVFKSS